jgi:hypothetical protein
MLNAINKGQAGDKVANLDAMGVESGGFKNTLAAAATADSGIDAKVGTFYVVDETNDNSAIVHVHDNGGTMVLAKAAGATNIDVVKDTASKVNIYFEGGTLNVQNNTAAEAIVTVKYAG